MSPYQGVLSTRLMSAQNKETTYKLILIHVLERSSSSILEAAV